VITIEDEIHAALGPFPDSDAATAYARAISIVLEDPPPRARPQVALLAPDEVQPDDPEDTIYVISGPLDGADSADQWLETVIAATEAVFALHEQVERA
jgi:hypothetical protein